MRFLLIVVLGLGIFFRFANLDYKVFWFDEAFTSLRASGYTEQEVVQHFIPPSVISVTELQRYQHPESTRSIIDTLQSLAKEDPQHSPLYYILAQVWFKYIGSSITAARLLSALISLLALPSAYWLCQELFVETGVFTSSLPTWMAIGLIAISPFQVLYAQESRHYGLWGVTTLLSTAALVRAIRLNNSVSWGIYALTLTINLYTFPFSGLVAIAHGISVVAISSRQSKTLIAYLQASLLGVIAFLPWAAVIATNLSQAHSVTIWTNYSVPLSDLLSGWVKSFGCIFFDVNLKSLDLYVHLVLLALVGYALYCLCSQTPKLVWLAIAVLISVPALSLMLPDLFLGGQRSTRTRYLIPSLLLVQLAVAYLLSHKLSYSFKSSHQYLWRAIAVILISGSVLSCIVSAKTPIWWHKDRSRENIAIAQTINQATDPLLISDAETGALLSLSHLLKPTVQILIRPRCYTCRIPASKGVILSALNSLDSSDTFLFHPNPPEEWLQELAKQQTYKLEPVVYTDAEFAKDKPALWRVISLN